MIGPISFGMLAAPVANLPIELGATLAPMAFIVAGLLVASVVGILAGRERQPQGPARFTPTITIEEEEALLRRFAA